MTTLALGPNWLDPDYLIQTFGLLGILTIVFAESGLLIGFFLPGDSLLSRPDSAKTMVRMPSRPKVWIR